MAEIDYILGRVENGDAQASDRLLDLVYGELRCLAATMLASERPGQTLQPTALVHEAYLKLVKQAQPSPTSAAATQPAAPQNNGHATARWNSQTHFFAAASEAMRRILVDRARLKNSEKHGGKLNRQQLLDSDVATVAPPDEVIAVHDALDALAAHEALTAELVKLRYYGGFSIEEAGALLGLSRSTAYRLWMFGRAWLKAELTDRSQSPQ